MNRFEQPPDVVYDMSRDVLRKLGFVVADSEGRHRLQGTVEGASVTITITPVSERMTELKVRARNKFLLPASPSPIRSIPRSSSGSSDGPSFDTPSSPSL